MLQDPNAPAGRFAPRPLTAAGFAGQRIGLLGGSFNPAHEGHLHISHMAKVRLGVDRVWWLVSPGNPLKSPAGMARFADRLAAARNVAAGVPYIAVTGLEAELGSAYTAHTLAWLRRHYTRTRFVWLMGADNLLQIHRWHHWTDIFRAMPVCVFPRPHAELAVGRALAAHRFAGHRLPPSAAATLADRRTPAWLMLTHPLHTASATALRQAPGGADIVRLLAEPGRRDGLGRAAVLGRLRRAAGGA